MLTIIVTYTQKQIYKAKTKNQLIFGRHKCPLCKSKFSKFETLNKHVSEAHVVFLKEMQLYYLRQRKDKKVFNCKDNYNFHVKFDQIFLLALTI